MKKYIFSLVCLCCALLPALEGQAALHEHPEYPDLRKSDANIVGHILDKKHQRTPALYYCGIERYNDRYCDRCYRTLLFEEPPRR